MPNAISHSGLSISCIAAALAQALYQIALSKLVQFAKPLVSGGGGDDLELVHRLRNHVLRTAATFAWRPPEVAALPRWGELRGDRIAALQFAQRPTRF